MTWHQLKYKVISTISESTYFQQKINFFIVLNEKHLSKKHKNIFCSCVLVVFST